MLRTLVFVVLDRLRLLHVENGCHAQSKSRTRHQVSYDTLMRLALVYLSELFLVVDLDTDAILQHVLNMLLAYDSLPIIIRRLNNLLKVRGMTPGDLNCSGCLGHMRKDSRQQAI